ncbi:MAG TPA: hypothetical protein VK694_06370 [Verrucomicrobiae bacterium]|nr:hypothetical protein [Verrucomicrobiae bacterium]
MTKQEHKAAKPRLIQDIQTQQPAPRSDKAKQHERFLLLRRKAGLLVRKKMFLGICGVLVLIGGVLIAYAVTSVAIPPIPAHLGQELGVTLYHPSKLPQDVVFKPAETATEKDSIITKFTDTTGKGSLFLTQQKRPQANLKQIDTQETYLATIGTVYFLKGEKDRLQAIVETDQTWILLDGSTSFGIDRAKEIISKLEVVR